MSQPSDQPPDQQPPQSYLPPIPVPPPPPPPPPPGGFPPGGLLSGGYSPGYLPPPPSSFTWQQVWRMALAEPSEDTYVDILNDPHASAQRGYVWVAVVYTITFAIEIAARSLGWSSLLVGSSSSGRSPAILFLCLPFIGAIGVILVIIGAGLQNIIARLLGGQGTFDEMVYAYSAFQSPILLISALLNLIPIVGCFSGLLGLYGLVLNVVAVKAVHKFDVGRALLTVFWWIPVGCVCAFLFACLAGPAMGNVLKDIMTQVATPQR